MKKIFRKGIRCFHDEHGNGLILRVNIHNIAKIKFDGEDGVVWLPVSSLEEELPENEVNDYIKSHHIKSHAHTDEPNEGAYPSDVQMLPSDKPFKAPNSSRANLPDSRTSSRSDSTDEAQTPEPNLMPVEPISLREMPVPAPDITSFCDTFKQCICAEIYESRSRFKQRRMIIHHAELIQENTEKSIYAIELDTEASYPDGSEITIWRERQSKRPFGIANVASCDGALLFIEANETFQEDISGMYYSVDEAALLEALNERLNELKESPLTDLVSDLIFKPKTFIQDHTISQDQLGQSAALKHALDAPITFIWGPPGTGKTETLAKIVLNFIAKGKRVLMLSQCNVSVDAAILRVHSLDKAFREGTCVRYGYPRAPQLTEDSSLTVSMIALKNNVQNFNRRSNLMRTLKKTAHSDPHYLELRKELEKITESMISEEKRIVRQASFIATTISKAVIDKTLYNDTFDVVMVDEASMAYIPQIIFAASLAKKHFICAGDFSQLPPITRARNTALEADIFFYTGISDAVAQNCSHAWLYMLDTQYRMHPAIAEFAGHFMYKGLLKSDASTQQRADIAACHPVSNEAIVLMNLIGSRITPVDSSKINLMSALMAFGVALNIIAQNQSIGIITPYNPQARLLRCMAKDLAHYDPTANTITCSTVHQFQGSEKDIILYDVTENAARSIMLVKNDHNYANRLFNVAMTRARGKLCILADNEFVYQQLPNNLMLHSLVKYYYHHCVNIRKQFASAVCNFPYHIMRAYCDQPLFDEVKIDIRLSSSTLMMTVSQDILPHLYSSGLVDEVLAKGLRGAKFKRILRVPDPDKFGLSASFFESSKTPESLLILDKRILWYFYTLNDSIIGIRFEGEQTVKRLQTIYFSTKTNW